MRPPAWGLVVRVSGRIAWCGGEGTLGMRGYRCGSVEGFLMMGGRLPNRSMEGGLVACPGRGVLESGVSDDLVQQQRTHSSLRG